MSIEAAVLFIVSPVLFLGAFVAFYSLFRDMDGMW